MDDVLSYATTLFNITAQTVVAVFTGSTGSATRCVFANGTGNYYVGQTSGGVGFTSHSNAASTQRQASGPSVVGNSIVAYRFRLDGSDVYVSEFVNNNKATTSWLADGMLAPAATTYYIGSLNVANYHNGNIFEVLVFNRDLLDREIMQLIQSLRDYWGNF